MSASLGQPLTPAKISGESQAPLVLRNVLMATDFSRCSQRALRFAIGIARRYGATLHLFHWLDPTAYRLVGEEAVAMAREAVGRDMKQLDTSLAIEGVLRNIKNEIVVEQGSLNQVLAKVIHDHSIDLVVIGTHGRTGWRKLILGSVAEKIFRQSCCPVLTVGPNVTRSRVNDDGAHDILFPTDFSPQARAAESYVFSMACKYGARLTLLRVFERTSEAATGTESMQIARARAELQALAAFHHSESGKTNFMVECGPTADIILRAAAQARADLIVLGVQARRPLADRLMWPNAYRIVCESACPVLTVRSLGKG